MKLLGICGSLREKSLNRSALLALGELLPTGDTLTIADISQIPLYNSDIQDSKGFPSSVELLAKQIIDADAVVFSSPEYNYSIPGVLKNAIDWVSRVPSKPFAQKVAGIMGVSPGAIGTARFQYHLRQVGVFLDIQFINKPEVMIGQGMSKFAEDGRLIDEPTQNHLRTFVAALAEAARKA
jgi:chromate reductase